MLYNNYVQALNIIETSVALAHAKILLDITDEDLEQWEKEQHEYFKTLGKEPEYNVLAVAYVELLQKLWDIKYVLPL